MGGAADGRVASGGVDQDEVGLFARLGERLLEAGEGLGVGGLGERGPVGAERMLDGHGRDDIVGVQPGPAMGEEVAGGLLAQVQVQHGDPGVGVKQCGGGMNGDGGLAGPALFVADHDDAGLRHVHSSLGIGPGRLTWP